MLELPSKTEQVKEHILKRIKSGDYKPGDKLPSIMDVGREFNVSKHTVSQALSNLKELGFLDVSRGKVTRVAEYPFLKKIALIYVGNHSIEKQDFWCEFYKGIIDEAKTYEDYSFINKTVPNSQIAKDYQVLDQNNTVGALLVGSANPIIIDYLNKHNIPFVMVYERIMQDDISYVSVDYRGVMKEIVDLFVKNNCRRLAYIGSFGQKGKCDVGINTHKFDCFISALQRNELEIDNSLFKDIQYSNELSYSATREILSAKRPDGIFVTTDCLIPGVCRALYDCGIKFPEDIRLASCDNLEISKFNIPSITVIELGRYKLGRQALATLVRKIDGDHSSAPVQIDLVPELIIRESLY